jgi:hypothetical protein
MISENTREGTVPVDGIKTYRRGEGSVIQLHSFLTSAIDGGECVNITPRPLYPRERTPMPLNTRLNRKHSRGYIFKTENKIWRGLSYVKLLLAPACSSLSLSLCQPVLQLTRLHPKKQKTAVPKKAINYFSHVVYTADIKWQLPVIGISVVDRSLLCWGHPTVTFPSVAFLFFCISYFYTGSLFYSTNSVCRFLSARLSYYQIPFKRSSTCVAKWRLEVTKETGHIQ